MKSYKVEFVETQKYVLDIQAENEEQARELATDEWNSRVDSDIIHYNEWGDTETEISMVYDVTGTDDDAFINNN